MFPRAEARRACPQLGEGARTQGRGGKRGGLALTQPWETKGFGKWSMSREKCRGTCWKSSKSRSFVLPGAGLGDPFLISFCFGLAGQFSCQKRALGHPCCPWGWCCWVSLENGAHKLIPGSHNLQGWAGWAPRGTSSHFSPLDRNCHWFGVCL